MTAPAFIPDHWFCRPATQVAPELVGCTLVRQFSDGSQVRGLIVETEAYEPGDPACHAYRRQTRRNAIMFGPAGVSYVYLIYGMYHCVNIVTDPAGTASAVLIRALELATLPSWVNPTPKPARVAAGPGKLCRVLQIDLSLNGTPLVPGQPLWLEPRLPAFEQQLHQQKLSLVQTTRIGLTQGVDLPWRWYLNNSLAVSRRG